MEREYQQIERISGCPHLMPGKHGLENNEGSIQAGYCFHLILMAISFSLGGRSILDEFNKQFWLFKSGEILLIKIDVHNLVWDGFEIYVCIYARYITNFVIPWNIHLTPPQN